MRLKTCISLLLAGLAFGGLAGCNEQKDYRFMLDRVPDHYRQCFEEIVDVPDGSLSQKQLLSLVVELRKSELRLQRCGRGAVKWVDAQIEAYNRFYQQY